MRLEKDTMVSLGESEGIAFIKLPAWVCNSGMSGGKVPVGGPSFAEGILRTGPHVAAVGVQTSLFGHIGSRAQIGERSDWGGGAGDVKRNVGAVRTRRRRDPDGQRAAGIVALRVGQADGECVLAGGHGGVDRS